MTLWSYVSLIKLKACPHSESISCSTQSPSYPAIQWKHWEQSSCVQDESITITADGTLLFSAKVQLSLPLEDPNTLSWWAKRIITSIFQVCCLNVRIFVAVALLQAWEISKHLSKSKTRQKLVGLYCAKPISYCSCCSAKICLFSFLNRNFSVSWKTWEDVGGHTHKWKA